MPAPVPSPASDAGLSVNDTMLRALGDLTRWRILRELAHGESLMVLEVAKRLGLPRTNASKHINTLRRGGLVAVGRGNLYCIPGRFLDPEQPGTVNYGPVVLRFGSAETGENA